MENKEEITSPSIDSIANAARRLMMTEGMSYDKVMDLIEGMVLSEAVVVRSGNVTKASEDLRINRSTVYCKMKRLGLSLERVGIVK